MSPKQRTARRLRCLGHVINLAAKAFLYGKDFDAFEKDVENVRENSELLKELDVWRKRGPVGKLHNVIVFICRSPQRRQKFADTKGFSTDEKTNFDHLNLVVDNATRWNSLFLMIDRALKLKDRIDSFCVDHADALHGALKDVPAEELLNAYSLRTSSRRRTGRLFLKSKLSSQSSGSSPFAQKALRFKEIGVFCQII